MINLRAVDLQWINGPEDDRDDLCAHAQVHFEVNETTFVQLRDGFLTVSAAALFLLRTLELDHTRDRPVAEHNLLFPCCAHSVWPEEKGRFGVVCMGCPEGVDLEVIHDGDHVRITAEDGRRETVTREEWRSAVNRFADQVREFHDRSGPKRQPEGDTDRQGWSLFWDEWKTRRVRDGA